MVLEICLGSFHGWTIYVTWAWMWCGCHRTTPAHKVCYAGQLLDCSLSRAVDMGYDVSNYNDIYPPFGTLEDTQRLIDEIHARGMRVIFDLVINHTSDQHAWFQASRSSRCSSKRDWYTWRPPKYDNDGNRIPPNNWRSYFTKSAWTWDEATQEYYLHLFAPEQPDLNWENKECRDAIYDSAIRFWLNRGVDGFRIGDAAHTHQYTCLLT